MPRPQNQRLTRGVYARAGMYPETYFYYNFELLHGGSDRTPTAKVGYRSLGPDPGPSTGIAPVFFGEPSDRPPPCLKAA
ncbi:hypothetical protein PGT21_007175 [Puccinia graminis f. sp. tritici]|uniref:Uncharacterized protein n=1 Tax=Puccinia graminis f. sp. tritici TaxID=56615 RepID=A0A5B0MDM4_PUCGR|nr:hypothetical protein PGTUg99_027796 [Puccinia graminis f. sp. tritici]KAA1090617.1 hypothetical protein PGT21_007175 [Puccinia graminis f. sp. tritici]